jgi:hypothetical protein
VTLINKKLSLGLPWAEIGLVFRPARLRFSAAVPGNGAGQARVIGSEMDFLGAAEQAKPSSASAFVAAAQSLGLRVFADPANTPADWFFFASLGVDAISARSRWA